MNTHLTEDNLNRLALGIIEKNGCSYSDALKILVSLKLYVKCGEAIRRSVSLQAALLTIVNTGKRAFLGGVHVTMPNDVASIIPWPFSATLNAAVIDLGAVIVSEAEIGNNFAIHLGLQASIDDNSIEVICNGWVGGISNGIDKVNLNQDVDFALGGILGGAIAVSAVFMRQTNINSAACDNSTGISLWRPDLIWTSKEAQGPQLRYLPKKAWLLGLGHLGQAYSWTLSMMPYSQPEDFKPLLQDFDRITDGNYSAGLLTDKQNTQPRKTRHCAEWLEAFGFEVTITERKYDSNTIRNNEEPYLALCGFDNAKSRLPLEESGFDLIVESAIGSGLSDFDSIITHTFPGANKKPSDIWVDETDDKINRVLLDAMQKEVKKEECGVLVTSLASKAMSASFVGAVASALVISEVLRALNGGLRFESIVVRLRSLKNIRTSAIGEYSTELGRNGFTMVANLEQVRQ
jgi:hypothetical protein